MGKLYCKLDELAKLRMLDELAKLYCKLDELAKLYFKVDELAKLRMSSMSWISWVSCTVSVRFVNLTLTVQLTQPPPPPPPPPRD